MSDAPRQDLTATDWAAMRKRVEAATPGPWAWEWIAEKSNEWAVGEAWNDRGEKLAGQIDTGRGSLEDTIIERRMVGMNESGNARWADADFIAHARTDLPLALDALARQQEANAELTAENARLAKMYDGACLCNTQNIEEAADRIYAAEAALADRDATIARLREFLTSEKARYQAVIDTDTVPVTFLHRIRGKRDMCGETLAQLPLPPAKEAE